MAAVVLTIDIDNSTTNVGLFDRSGTLRFRSGLTTSRNPTRDQCAISLMNLFTLYHADLKEVSGAVISSVVPSVTAHMSGAVELLTGKAPMLMGPGIKTGLNIKSDLHNQLGSDIVACSVAAMEQYPTPIIIIDMGTAVTMSYLHDRTYEGCMIFPGVLVALDENEQPSPVPPLILETEEDKIAWEAAERRQELRRQRRIEQF